MRWLGSLLIFASAVALAALAGLRARRAQRAPVRRQKETETRPSDWPASPHEDASAESGKGEPQNTAQEAPSVPQNRRTDTVEVSPAAPNAASSTANKGFTAEPERGADDQGNAGNATTELDIPADAEPSDALQTAPPASAETGNPIADDAFGDATEGECGTAKTDPQLALLEASARDPQQTGEADAQMDAAPADQQADATERAADGNADSSAAEEREAERGEVEPADTYEAMTVGPALAHNNARSRRPTTYRDRRGMRRTPPRPAASVQNTSPLTDIPPAAASLRLALHAIRRTVSLSLVLSRPEGFPEQITLLLDGRADVGAYDESRYDDIDVAWTSNLLVGELRLNSADGFRWIRSARRVHIFTADPSEPGLVSVSAVHAGADHTLICRVEDVAAVRAIAQQGGSPELVPYDHWQGIPEGWSVLSGYKPAQATGPIADASFRPLDPGADTDIMLGGGLAIRPRIFAEGHPPCIEIRPLPENATVTIGGQPALQNAGGAWEAPGWDAPGQHTVDVVPGPSLSYEIAADPGNGEGWPFWNAHEELPGGRSSWSRAGICGAMLQGAAGEIVLACEAQSTMIALGASRGAVPLERRSDANVSVALVVEPPAFVVATSGPRRRQGRVIWLGEASDQAASAADDHSDLAWADAVYRAAVRRLPLVGADRAGEAAWRRAVLRARKLRRRCR